MKEAYLYPITAYAHKAIPNPYLDNLMNSLEKDFHFVNRESPSTNGIFDIMGYYKRIDYLFLNWVEDLPDKKGGWLQGLFFILMVYVLKLRKTRIIWTMHNKLSHYKSNYYFKRFLFKFLLVQSDCIITHSLEGIQYTREYNIKNQDKIKYFPHPVEKKFIPFKSDPAYDILIWGSIMPYKGIDKFLQYLYDHNLQNKYRIRIIGEVRPPEYEQEIMKLCNQNIQVDNRYIPVEELKISMADSKLVIFTYVGDSVLSSGVLMDTLSYGGNILAPRVGAFKDAEQEGLIRAFKTYDDLIPLIDNGLSSPMHANTGIIEKFIEKSNWHQFSLKVSEWLN
jgi:beta-1,4-mannosyltransferase